jgi:hypothetical protein
MSTVSPSIGPPVSMVLISRACFYAVKSMKHLLWSQKEDERWIVSGFCKCLLSLFVLLAENDEELGGKLLLVGQVPLMTSTYSQRLYSRSTKSS